MCANANYWSATTQSNNTHNAWVVYLAHGITNSYTKTDTGYSVRCVRWDFGLTLELSLDSPATLYVLSKSAPISYKLTELLKDLYKVVHNLPKEYKFNLGRDIITRNWELIDLFTRAQVRRGGVKQKKKL